MKIHPVYMVGLFILAWIVVMFGLAWVFIIR